MWVMYDSIEPNQIPESASAVAGYVGGHWPTFPVLQQRWPAAQKLSICVTSGEDGECLDVEQGDATSQDAPAWFHRQVARGVDRPCLYASLDPWNEVLFKVMDDAGIPRTAYRKWAAEYTYHPHIPQGFDACQWTDRALGRNLDESLCADTFFAVHVSPANFFPADEARWTREWRSLKGVRTLAAHKRRVALKAAMTKRRKEIYIIATRQPHGWEVLNRYNRYMILKSYTK